MTPETAALRFLYSVLTGGALGVWYGFLGPVRWRRPVLADTLFSLAALWGGLWFGFAVCRGDLRMGYLTGFLLGGGAVQWALGAHLFRISAVFWKRTGRICRLLALPGKKSLKFAKKMFASAEKWVTIKWSNHVQRYPGGTYHGRKKAFAEKRKDRGQAQPQGAEDPADPGYSVFYGCASDPAYGS